LIQEVEFSRQQEILRRPPLPVLASSQFRLYQSLLLVHRSDLTSQKLILRLFVVHTKGRSLKPDKFLAFFGDAMWSQAHCNVQYQNAKKVLFSIIALASTQA
jgi:hypothetical protein